MEREKENEEFLRKIRESLKDLERYRPSPPKVRKNKNYQTISVSHAFDFERIPIKIVAPYATWIDFEEKYLEDGCHIEFGELRPFISRPSKKTLPELEKYYRERREDFDEHFYHYYIEPSKDKNPLVTTRLRGGSPYGLTRSKMWKVRTAARHLYVLLGYWLKQPKNTHPPWLKACLDRYEIRTSYILPATMEIIEKRFNLGIDKIEAYKTFYDKYIAYQGLDRLKKMYEKKNYLPFREPLLSIFHTS